MPKARDLADLNTQLLAACREDERRQIVGRSQPVGAAMIAEREHLLPSVEHGFELGRSHSRAWMAWVAYGCGPISIRCRLK
jgi:hypothetical protein